MVGKYTFVEITDIHNMFGCAYVDEVKACCFYQDTIPCHGIPNKQKIFLVQVNALWKEEHLCPWKQNEDDGQSKHQRWKAYSWITLLSI
jgi:hypothetical protein